MPKKINTIERGTEGEEPLESRAPSNPAVRDGDTGGKPPRVHDTIVASVEPVKKRREMSEEQRQRQADNLKRGREALQQKREEKLKEQAKMLHDVVTEAKPKREKKDKLQDIVKAVQAIQPDAEDDEEEDQIVVVKKKKRAPKKIIVVEEEEEDTPPAPVTKPKRQYKKREPKAQPVEEEHEPEPAPRPSVLFY